MIKPEETQKIEIWDAIMGSGKTIGIIKILRKNPNAKIIFVTEYKDEIKRVLDEVPDSIVQPLESGGEGKKSTHLVKLLKSGINIATTHKLFTMIQKEDYHLLDDYTMILDEVVSVIEKIKISEDDVKLLQTDKVIGIDSDNKVFVINKNYKGEFKKRVERIGKGDVHYFQNQLIWMVNAGLFRAFKQIVIATYLFEGSYLHNYFMYNNIGHKIVDMISAGRYKVSDYINLYENKKVKIGTKQKNVRYRPLSSNFYKNANKNQFDSVSRVTYNFFKYFCKTGAAFNGFSIFDGYEDKLTKDGFGTLIAVNARATNKYGNIKSMAYLVEMNPDPTVCDFLNAGMNKPMDENKWRLAVLVQWLFRGCIRNVKREDKINDDGDWDKMNVMILSKSMNELFQSWLKRH